MRGDALNRVCCNFQNTVAAMSVRERQTHGPTSCLCPICNELMQLSRLPALKALDTIEFYLRCDDCDYTSAQLTEIISSELVCDIHREAHFRPTASDPIAWCEQGIAGLARASGERSENRSPRSPRSARSPPIPGDSARPTRGSIGPDKRMRPVYALSGLTTLGVACAIVAALAGYFVAGNSPPAMILAAAPRLTSNGTRLVTLLPLLPAVPSPIELKGVRSENGLAEPELAPDSEDRHTVDRSAMPKSNPSNRPSLLNNANPVLDAQDMEPPVEQGRQLLAAGDTAAAHLSSTHPANTGDVTAASVNQDGFLFANPMFGI